MVERKHQWRNRLAGDIVDVPPDQLVPSDLNFRRHPGPQQDALSGIIDEIGYLDPVLVQAGTDRVIDGHLRVELALRTGQPTIPVQYVDLTDAEADLALATFDPISAMAYHDDQNLAALLAQVETDDEAVRALLDSLAPEVTTITEGLTDPDAVPEPPAEPITKPGDLWVLGRHRLLCGDSTVITDVQRLMAGERARLMPTDPPYLVDYKGGNHPQSWHNKPDVKDKHWDDYNEGDGATFFSDFIAVALAEALVPNPAIYQWHADLRRPLVSEAWKNNGLLLHQIIVWVKARPVLTRSHFMWQHEPCAYGWIQGKQPDLKPPADAKTVWEINQQGESDGIHPTQKPVEIVKRPIEYHTVPGDLIYEPFSGSGTAIIAAEQTGRRCYAMELSPAFVDAAVNRWEQFTGQQATLAPRLDAMAAD